MIPPRIHTTRQCIRWDNAFYSLFLKTARKLRGDGYVVVDVAVPVQPGDVVTLLAIAGGEKPVWERPGMGLAVKVSPAMLAKRPTRPGVQDWAWWYGCGSGVAARAGRADVDEKEIIAMYLYI